MPFSHGRATFQDWPWQLKPGNKLDLPEEVDPVGRTDFIADADAEKYAVAIDGSGKLAWSANTMLHGASDIYVNRAGDHIVTVLTESVSDAYLHYLRELGVSYIFGGEESLDMALVMEKLHALLGINHVLLEGGGRLNGSLIRDGLIDEYKVLLMATVDGGEPGIAPKTSFDASPGQGAMLPVDFVVKDVEQIDDTGLLLTFARR